MTTAPVPSSPEPIHEDLPCIGCHYNLRTRTAADRCPECGLPIVQTLAHWREHARALADPRMFRAAARVLAAACLVPLPAFTAIYLLKALTAGARAPQLLLIETMIQVGASFIFAAAVLLSVFLMGGALSSKIVAAGTRSAVALLAAGYAALSGMTLLTCLALPRRGRFLLRRLFMPLVIAQEQRIMGSIVYLILAIAGFVVMKSYARSIASARLGRWTTWVFLAVAGDFALALTVYLGMHLGQPRRAWMLGGDFVYFSIDLTTAAVACVFAWYWLGVSRTTRPDSGPAEPVRGPAAPSVTPPAVPPGSPEEKVSEFLTRRRGSKAL